jgi:hypothetical protein
VNNPAQWELPVAIFTPTGPGECSAPGRPVIFFGHGYTASFTFAYTQLMEHLVSRGFVVIYPGFKVEFDPPQHYRAMNAGFVAGAASFVPGALDLSRIGFIGHSWGAGMIPRMMQLAVGRGWGTEALWAVPMAPAWAFEVGDGPIELPDHARVLGITYEWDAFVDTRVATEMIGAMTIPEGHKQQLLIHLDASFDPALASDHMTPLTISPPVLGPMLGSLDHYDRWATWRPIDAWAGCSLWGKWCDVDLGDMGSKGGRQVKRATVGYPLRDVGPGAIVECAGFLSPRRCW